MSNDSEMESEKSFSASILQEIAIVPEPEATTVQVLSHNENSQSTSLCSVQEPIIAGLDLPVLPVSNDIPVLHVVDSSAHDHGSVTCPTVSSESAADGTSLTSVIIDESQSIAPAASTVSAPSLSDSSLSQCSEPTIQSTSVIAAASTVLPVSSTVESHKDDNTNKYPQTSSSPITTPPRQPRSSIMSSEDDDEEAPEAGPETETRESNSSLQQRLSELEALVEQQNADLETLQSRMTRQDAEARKRIANLQTEHRSRVEHLQRTFDELRSEKDAMVMKYAVSEQRAIELTQRAERAERAAKDSARDRDAANQRAKAAKTDADKVRFHHLKRERIRV